MADRFPDRPGGEANGYSRFEAEAKSPACGGATMKISRAGCGRTGHLASNSKKCSQHQARAPVAANPDSFRK